MRHGVGDGQQVERAHARRQQRLMRVSHGRVGEQQALFRLHPFRECFRAQRLQLRTEARRRLGLRAGWDNGVCQDARAIDPGLDVGPSVDGHVAEIRQNLVRAIARRAKSEQLGRGIDEFRGGAARHEGRMQNQISEKRNVRLHAADAEFAQRSIGAPHGLFQRLAPRGHLDEQRIEVRRDDRAAEAVAAVQAYREAAR